MFFHLYLLSLRSPQYFLFFPFNDWHIQMLLMLPQIIVYSLIFISESLLIPFLVQKLLILPYSLHSNLALKPIKVFLLYIFSCFPTLVTAIGIHLFLGYLPWFISLLLHYRPSFLFADALWQRHVIEKVQIFHSSNFWVQIQFCYLPSLPGDSL